jgi:hypothetical protein
VDKQVVTEFPSGQGSQLPIVVVRPEARQARRRMSRHGVAALAAMLVPAVLFPTGLFLLREDARFAWLRDVRDYPMEFWIIAVCGSFATGGGILDWLHHRSGETTVGRREHRAHVLALATGGLPLFVLLTFASLSPQPLRLLLPVLVLLIYTVVLISYDEFVFHRRCNRFETVMHRLLTFGNGLAFLAWTHWCFVSRSVGP